VKKRSTLCGGGETSAIIGRKERGREGMVGTGSLTGGGGGSAPRKWATFTRGILYSAGGGTDLEPGEGRSHRKGGKESPIVGEKKPAERKRKEVSILHRGEKGGGGGGRGGGLCRARGVVFASKKEGE